MTAYTTSCWRHRRGNITYVIPGHYEISGGYINMTLQVIPIIYLGDTFPIHVYIYIYNPKDSFFTCQLICYITLGNPPFRANFPMKRGATFQHKWPYKQEVFPLLSLWLPLGKPSKLSVNWAMADSSMANILGTSLPENGEILETPNELYTRLLYMRAWDCQPYITHI